MPSVLFFCKKFCREKNCGEKEEEGGGVIRTPPHLFGVGVAAEFNILS